MTTTVARLLLPLAIATSVLLPPLTGEWSGSYRSSEAGGTLELRVDSTARGWEVSVRASSQYVADPQFRAAERVRVTGDSLHFVLDWGGPVTWRGRVLGDSVSGVLSTDHWNGTWSVTRRRGAANR